MTHPAPARVLCVSGDSGSGKTSLILRLLARLPQPGDATAVVKHTHHAIDWHPSGKDSAVLWDAGPAALAVAGPDQTAIFERMERAGSGGGDDGDPGDRGSGADGTGGDDGASRDDGGTAATRRLVRTCRRLPPRIRLVLAEGFRDARAPRLWTADGPPGPERVPREAVAAVVPAERRDAWTEELDGTEVFSREEMDAIAARVGEWAAPVTELPGR